MSRKHGARVARAQRRRQAPYRSDEQREARTHATSSPEAAVERLLNTLTNQKGPNRDHLEASS